LFSVGARYASLASVAPRVDNPFTPYRRVMTTVDHTLPRRTIYPPIEAYNKGFLKVLPMSPPPAVSAQGVS